MDKPTPEERARAWITVLVNLAGLAVMVLATIPDWRLRQLQAIARAHLARVLGAPATPAEPPPSVVRATIESAERIAREAAEEVE